MTIVEMTDIINDTMNYIEEEILFNSNFTRSDAVGCFVQELRDKGIKVVPWKHPRIMHEINYLVDVCYAVAGVKI